MPRPSPSGDHVPPACGGVISTPVLQTLCGIAHDVVHGQTVSHEAGELFMLCIPGLLDELLERRQREALVRLAAPDVVLAGGNVLPFPGGL